MIMTSKGNTLRVLVRPLREERGWSQAELAERAQLSRSEISAIENGRLVPSTTAALRLANALSRKVEDLFSLESACPAASHALAWGSATARYWVAEANGTLRRYPQEALHGGAWPMDEPHGSGNPPETLILATCDPAAGILVRMLDRAGVRCLAFPRSSSLAMELLGSGTVHAVGIHLGKDGRENAARVRRTLGRGFTLLRIATWEEGVAFAPASAPPKLTARALRRLRWIGREPGSGARRCADELLEHPARLPEGYDRYMPDHRSVATAIRAGLAEVGVCHRLCAEEAGLGFQSTASESYDLCLRTEQLSDPRVLALLRTVRSTEFRSALASLPGMDSRCCGELIPIS